MRAGAAERRPITCDHINTYSAGIGCDTAGDSLLLSHISVRAGRETLHSSCVIKFFFFFGSKFGEWVGGDKGGGDKGGEVWGGVE